MVDTVANTSPGTNTFLAGHSGEFGFTQTTEAVGNASQHILNALHIAEKAVYDSAGDIKTAISLEGRSIDNRVCMLEKHIADTRCELGKEVLETKFELSKQLESRFGELKYDNLLQETETRNLIKALNTSSLERELADCKLREATTRSDTGLVSAIVGALAPILQQLVK